MSYRKDKKEYWGVLAGDKIIEVSKENKDMPRTLLEYIKGKKELMIDETTAKIDLCEVEILPPIMPERNIVCVGKNYRNHVMEMDRSGEDLKFVEETPVFFTKGTNAVNSHMGGIPSHEGITSSLDYEGELAVVIGKRCTNLKEEDVPENIFGYTILNDITARDIQKGHKQWFRGKSLDGSCPIGPYIVTRGEVEDVQKLKIETWVNDEKRQEGNTGHMIRPVCRLISEFSQGITLEPGDIIATGTPEGVGAGFNPPRFLRKNDVVKIKIENIGYLENRIV